MAGEKNPENLPKAKVVPIPNDRYIVEYDSIIKGMNARKLILLKNLKQTIPIIMYFSLNSQIIKTENDEQMDPKITIGNLPHSSM